MKGNKTKVFKFLLFAFLLLSALFACKDLFGPLDNPVDRESENYQGYDTILNADDIKIFYPANSRIAGSQTTFIVSEVRGASEYQIQISSSQSDFENNILFDKSDYDSNKINISTENLSHSVWYYWRARAQKNGDWGKWTEISSFIIGYTLSYDGNGNDSGAIPTNNKAYIEGDIVVVLANTGNLAKTGYNFTGWNTDLDGSGTNYQPGSTFIMGSSNVTLYANWTISNPTIVSFCDTPGYAKAVAVAGSYAYVADQDYGLRIIDVSNSKAPKEVGSFENLGWSSEVVVVGSYAYVAHGGGLSIIDVSNPTSPIEIGFCYTSGKGVAVAGSYAYVADGDYGLHIIDVSNPTSPVEIGFCSTPGDPQGVAVAGSYAYVADWMSGLRVIDVSNPRSPIEVGSCSPPYYANKVAVAGSYAFETDEYYFAKTMGLHIIDVSNPGSPTEIGFCSTPGDPCGIALEGPYAYIADWMDGLQVIDVSNPTSPVRVASCSTNFAYGIALAGSYAYVAGYDQGLIIIQVR